MDLGRTELVRFVGGVSLVEAVEHDYIFPTLSRASCYKDNSNDLLVRLPDSEHFVPNPELFKPTRREADKGE